jgi:hypothetical protein
MPMETHEVTATITFESTFFVEARDEDSAETKLTRLLNSVDLFEAVEGRSDKFNEACWKNDVHAGGPMNEYDFSI